MEIQIEGVAPHIDGTYELPAPLTTRELHEVKLASGVRPFEISDAYASGDAAFKAVMAVIALRRVGKVCPIELLLDLEYDKTGFRFPELEGDAAASEKVDPTTGSPTESSGTDSRSSSESQADAPKVSGAPTSRTRSAGSARAASAT